MLKRLLTKFLSPLSKSKRLFLVFKHGFRTFECRIKSQSVLIWLNIYVALIRMYFEVIRINILPLWQMKMTRKTRGKEVGLHIVVGFFIVFFLLFFVFFLFSDDVHTKESFVGRDSLQGKNFLNTLLATLSYPGRSSILLLWHTVHKRPLNTRLIYNSNNINQLTDRIKNMPKT